MRCEWKNLRFSALLCAGACLLSGCGRSYNPDPVADLAVVADIRAEGGAAATSDAGPAVTSGSGWGTLKGSFVLVGAAPQPKTLATLGKDAQVCDLHPQLDPTLQVDAASRGIRDVVIYARKASRVHDSYDSLVAQPVLFDQKECRFLEQVTIVYLGQQLLVRNSDPVLHNTAIKPPGDKDENPVIAPNDTFIAKFKRSQNKPFAVTCSMHTWMKAFVFPRKDPYAAVSKEDGTFEISNLPAGEELEFQIWHAAGAGADNGLKTSQSGPDGRFKLKIPADDVQDMQKIEVPLNAFNL